MSLKRYSSVTKAKFSCKPEQLMVTVFPVDVYKAKTHSGKTTWQHLTYRCCARSLAL